MRGVSGLVLAGGGGRRMGAPKALVPFRGRPLVAWPLGALARVADELLVATGVRTDLDRRADLLGGARAVPDAGDGPLAGLRAGAHAAVGEWLLVAPCDAPRVTPALFEALLRLAGGRDAAMPRLEGRAQPLVACYRRSSLLAALERVRLPRELPDALDVAWLEDPALSSLARDADTPEELAALEAKGSASSHSPSGPSSSAEGGSP